MDLEQSQREVVIKCGHKTVGTCGGGAKWLCVTLSMTGSLFCAVSWSGVVNGDNSASPLVLVSLVNIGDELDCCSCASTHVVVVGWDEVEWRWKTEE